MGQTSGWGSNPGSWAAWVQSGSNYMNVIHQGSTWSAPTVGRFISHSAYFAGYSGGCQALMNVWRGDNLALYCSSAGLGVAQGGASSGGQGWQQAATSGGPFWIGGPYPTGYQFGWGRDPAASHVFSTASDGGTYWGDTNTGGYTVSSISGSTQAPMGFNGSVGATATMQDLLIYVRRSGGWNLCLVRTQRAGGAMDAQLYPVYKKPGNNPIQRLGGFELVCGRPLLVAVRRGPRWVDLNRAMANPKDPIFARRMANHMRLEDYDVQVFDHDAHDWAPGLLLMHESITSEFGTDRRKWDLTVGRQRGILAAA